jgi:SAM-dependent methyltransferase
MSPADRDVLARVVGPVLDVGCGPGRHVAEMARRGQEALGLDTSAAAVDRARRRGAAVAHGSVFEPVPGAGAWVTVLLLDGNVGIGGDPVRLLRRCVTLLRPGGRLLVELEPPWQAGTCGPARIETYDSEPCANQRGRYLGPWFSWATVSASQIESLAAATGFVVMETWSSANRWFADLCRPGCCMDEALTA